MAEAFDPYHKWLGIPPEDQPPNHYRLLAINLFEFDPDVIAGAADQRMGHVRTFQTGRNSVLSQEILNEISVARVCLLNSEKKAEYDQELRRRLVSSIEDPTPGYRLGRKRPPWQLVAAIGVAAVLCGGVARVLLSGGDLPAPDDRPPVPDHKPPVPDEKATVQLDKPPVPDDKPLLPDDRPPVPDDRPPLPDDKPPVAGGKLPLPSIDARRKAGPRLKELFVAASAERLLEAAVAENYDDAEKFVLLTMAGDVAAAAGDTKTALRAVDEKAKRYEVDVLAVKAATLAKVKDGAKTPAAFRAVAEHGLALIDQAEARGKHELAKNAAVVALSAARKAGDSELVAKVTLRFLELQGQPAGEAGRKRKKSR